MPAKGRATDEHLADHRLDRLHRFAEHRGVARHVPPAEQDLAFVLDRPLDLVLAREPRRRLLGQEHRADAVLARGRQGHAPFSHLFAEQAIRDLDQDAGAVARLGIGTHRPAVGEVFEDEQPLLDDLVALAALDVRDEADAAGVVFAGGVIEPLAWRKVGWSIHVAPCIFPRSCTAQETGRSSRRNY